MIKVKDLNRYLQIINEDSYVKLRMSCKGVEIKGYLNGFSIDTDLKERGEYCLTLLSLDDF